MLKKINAVLGLITSLLLLDHAVFFTVWMFSEGNIEKSAPAIPRLLALLMVVHGILSLALILINRKGSEKKEYKAYCKLNAETYVQRISGVIMLILLAFHIIGALNGFQPKILHAVLHPLFFAATLAHASVSFGKALVSLGIGSAGAIKIINIASKLICLIISIASIIGLYIYLF